MGTLFVVATPIGNLEDITLRALRVLKEVDLIACEDTRITKRLLDHYQIATPTISYHQHSQIGKIDFLIGKLKEGKNLALVSDAGTPGISDPGRLLAAAAWQEKIKIEAIPGPTAMSAALSLSGLSADCFFFFGFLPHKKGRQTRLKEIAAAEYTSVFYESVHRILKTLAELKELNLERQIVVCRELTKIYETVYRGTAAEILERLSANEEEVKGEFVVIVEGK